MPSAGGSEVRGQRSEQLDILQHDISQHLQLGDAAQILDPVFVIQLVKPVNSDSELLGLTQDDHLETKTHHHHHHYNNDNKVYE